MTEYIVMDSAIDRALPVYEKIDWPILIKIIVDRGKSMKEVSKITGFGYDKLLSIRSESCDVEWLDRTCSLMQLYRDISSDNFPIVGEHHELYD